jgi:energy-coupling factor transporter ATP-binding protein EcfA2
VRPRGKKIDTLAQLSSGERALTAIALLFSIYLVKPSPFCVFDEVDAPLDDANIGRFVHLLQEFKDHTQFIVITHNKLTMEAADRLYGVTMEEEGVSKLVSVALDGELKGTPRALRRKTERQRRAAAILAPEPAHAGERGGNGHTTERPAARLDPEGHADEVGTALLEPEALAEEPRV